jgi:sRNA-binding regulator protein Hfq
VPAPAPAAPNKTVDLDVIGPPQTHPPHPAGQRPSRARQFRRDQEPTLIARSFATRAAATQESSHAEAFYLQKQLQTQTPMVFILDDNEKIEGCIEWYDRNVIKVRSTGSRSLYFRANSRSESGARILVYKSSIKYLYKAGENSPL